MTSIWVLRAGALYMALVFPAAVLLGVLRALVLTPALGPLWAVALELPLVLALAWIVARRLLRARRAPPGARIAMGAVAFCLLMLAELAMAVLVFGQSPAGFGAAMATPPGLLGLAGQIGFGLIPLLQRPAPRR